MATALSVISDNENMKVDLYGLKNTFCAEKYSQKVYGNRLQGADR